MAWIYSSLNMDENYPNGESPNMFYDRVKAAFEHLLYTYRNKKVPRSYKTNRFFRWLLKYVSSFDLKDVQADSSGETEAGTMQRDVIRSGVVNIQVSFQVSACWLQKLSAFRKLPMTEVRYFDSETLDYKYTQMYIDGFKSSLEKDTSYKSLWKVSFDLIEY